MNKDDNSPNTKPAGPADYLANERTFLAWIRTSIALMAFGFVIVRFAVFVRQAGLLTGHNLPAPESKGSGIIGIVMVTLGALMTILAYLRYRMIDKSLQHNTYYPSKQLSLAVAVSLVIAGVVLVWYLLPNAI